MEPVIKAHNDGMEVRCSDGFVRDCCPIVAAWLGDREEHELITAIVKVKIDLHVYYLSKLFLTLLAGFTSPIARLVTCTRQNSTTSKNMTLGTKHQSGLPLGTQLKMEFSQDGVTSLVVVHSPSLFSPKVVCPPALISTQGGLSGQKLLWV